MIFVHLSDLRSARFSKILNLRLKLQQLDNCRLGVIDISIQEADSDIESLKLRFKSFFANVQGNVSKQQFLNLSKLAKSTENSILLSQKRKHENKLFYAIRPQGTLLQTLVDPAHYKPERAIKHQETLNLKRRRRNQFRRVKCKEILVC